MNYYNEFDPNRTVTLKGPGNAIIAQVAAEFIKAVIQDENQNA